MRTFFSIAGRSVGIERFRAASNAWIAHFLESFGYLLSAVNDRLESKEILSSGGRSKSMRAASVKSSSRFGAVLWAKSGIRDGRNRKTEPVIIKRRLRIMSVVLGCRPLRPRRSPNPANGGHLKTGQ